VLAGAKSTDRFTDCGRLVAGTHLTVPSSAETLLKLLSGATSPCALVSLGLFLDDTRLDGGYIPKHSLTNLISGA
jgi:predicted permease